MTAKRLPARRLGWASVALAMAGVPAYLFSTVIPGLPGEAARIAFFAFGPLYAAGAVAFGLWMYRLNPSLSALLGVTAGVAAGVIQNMMALIQTVLVRVQIPRLETLADETARIATREALRSINQLQTTLDLNFDIWVSAATVLFALAAFKTLPLGRLLALFGVLAGAGALAMNFWTFPEPPAQAGGIDLGPLVGAWYAVAQIAVLAQLLRGVDPDR